ncbi:MAG: DVU_1553 family AMP-dependent CoA ligase [Oscillospiraceae bacterium]
MRMTPLHQWAQEKTGGLPIEAWQLKKLRDTLTLARNSLFYRERLPGTMPEHIADIRRLPLMEMGTMVRQEQQLLCVPPQEIQRIVTIWTSGTTGRPKRLYFTAQDLELTIDFFARGLPTLVKPGDVMAVMMPCRVTSGVGDLICRGLKRIPVDAVPWGPLTSFAETKAMLQDKNVTSIVGMPAQVLALTRYLAITNAKTSLQSVLLSADNISPVMVRELKERGLQVYLHFGMTETGYGCAIDCDAHAGQHIREPDLLVEIVDPITGQPMPDGHWGEIVITTLTRRGYAPHPLPHRRLLPHTAGHLSLRKYAAPPRQRPRTLERRAGFAQRHPEDACAGSSFVCVSTGDGLFRSLYKRFIIFVSCYFFRHACPDRGCGAKGTGANLSVDRSGDSN